MSILKKAIFLFVLSVPGLQMLKAQNPAPPNEPAAVIMEHGQLTITYAGKKMLSANVDDRNVTLSTY